MARIRPMMSIDVSRVAWLHHAAMGESLWSKLGLAFLRELYQGLINSDRFLGFVYVEDGEVKGFIAGSTDADAMMSEVFRSRWPVLGVAALPALRRPGVLLRLLETARYFDKSTPGESIPAESLFCSFQPELRGRRISGHINKVLFDELLSRGIQQVKITTEVSNEGANRQLMSWGFVDRGRFRFYGKDMVTYVLDLTTSDRVEAVSRHPAV
jgi:RimJ/RimL family protein N-acetyltransferase